MGGLLLASDVRLTAAIAVALIVVASLVALGAQRYRIPQSIALVAVGLALGVSHLFVEVRLTQDLIFLVILPPLLFEGALNIDISDLARRWAQIGVLAVAGTVVAAGVIAVPLVAIVGMPAWFGVLIAVMLAPTDPVSVLAMFKESGVVGGLRTILEAESLFNDALGIVLYSVAVQFAFPTGAPPSVWLALWDLAREVGVGVGVGVLVGAAAHRLVSALDDHATQIMVSVAAAYGSFVAADAAHGSGVTATIVAGLMVANFRVGRVLDRGIQTALTEFWEVVAVLANSAIFLLIGLQFRPGDLGTGRTAFAAVCCIVGLLAGRAVLAYGMLWPFRSDRRTPVDRPPRRWIGPPVEPGWRTAIYWGGLRGTIPVALVLGLPRRTFGRVDSVALVFAVVITSIVVQGITYQPLLRKLGIVGGSADR